MAFNLFLESVQFVVGLNTYDIPISNMSVRGGPYSRELNSGVAVRAFDGRVYQQYQGWRTYVDINWPEMTPDSNATLYDMIVDMAANGSATLVLNPDTGGNTIDVVMTDPANALKAVFSNGARKRPANLQLVSTDISASSPDWIVNDPEAATIMWIDTNGDYYTTSSDLATTVQPNTSLDLSPYSDARQLEFDPHTNKLWFVNNGVVYNFNRDGSGFTTLFDSGLGTSVNGLVINPTSQLLALTAYHPNPVVAYREFRLYDYSGTLFDSFEFRSGLSSLQNQQGQFYNGTYYYMNTSSILAVFPPFVGDGSDIQGLGALAHVSGQDSCVINDNVYSLFSPGIYVQSALVQQTGSPGDNDTLVATVPNGSDQIDAYEFGGVTYLVGGGSGGEFRATTGGSVTTNWGPVSAANVHLLTT